MRFVDPDGMQTKVVITGDDSESAAKQLDESTSLKITRNPDNGELSASGEANTDADKQLLSAINDPDITVEVNANKSEFTSTGAYYPGGAMMGTEITDEGCIIAKQEVSPPMLSEADEFYNTPGAGMMHEVTEGFEAGKITKLPGTPSPPAGQPGSVYEEAHEAAVPGPDIFTSGRQEYSMEKKAWFSKTYMEKDGKQKFFRSLPVNR